MTLKATDLNAKGKKKLSTVIFEFSTGYCCFTVCRPIYFSFFSNTQIHTINNLKELSYLVV